MILINSNAFKESRAFTLMRPAQALAFQTLAAQLGLQLPAALLGCDT